MFTAMMAHSERKENNANCQVQRLQELLRVSGVRLSACAKATGIAPTRLWDAKSGLRPLPPELWTKVEVHLVSEARKRAADLTTLLAAEEKLWAEEDAADANEIEETRALMGEESELMQAVRELLTELRAARAQENNG